jgi:tetratricopeptide (TPR) repeat protein
MTLAKEPLLVQADLQKAIALHQRGQLVEAEQIYRNILRASSDHGDAIHLLGVVLLQRGQPVEAEKLIARAVGINPNNPDVLNNHGSALLYLKRFEEALASFDRAITLAPDRAQAFYNRGNALKKMSRFEETLTSYDRAIALKPNYAEAFNNRGNVLKELKRFEEALASYDQAIAFKPDYVEVWYNRGCILQELERFEQALASYDQAIALKRDYAEAFNNRGATLQKLRRLEEALVSCNRAIALKPDYAEAFNNRGNVLKDLKRFEEALADYDQAIALKPDYAEFFNNRGIVLKELKRLEEALASCDRAVALRPDYAEAFNNRGNALKDLKRFEEAQASYDRAIALKPDYAEAFNNRGNAFQNLKRFEEALASYDRAIALKSDYADGYFNRGFARLLIGKYSEGWPDYEWRWTETLGTSRRDFPQALWRGDAIAGKTILLHAEQGVGDTIQFCRFAELVTERGGRVILEVQPALKRLLSKLEGTQIVLARGEPLPPFDVHCPLLSLPLAFCTQLATIPPPPRLRVPAELVQEWERRLGPRSKPRMGIVWAGNPSHKNDQNRSIPLDTMLALRDLPIQLISLQKEVRNGDQDILAAHPDIAQFGSELTDFLETAALVSALDMVISVDTSVAHLAATLGKPTWILLPFLPDWRWLLDREDSPWYPTMRLFRQPEQDNWTLVFAKIKQELSSMLSENQPLLRAVPPVFSAASKVQADL